MIWAFIRRMCHVRLIMLFSLCLLHLCICIRVLRQVSPNMCSSELAESALSMKNVTCTADDIWTTFEVIENGDLGKRVFLQLQKLLLHYEISHSFVSSCVYKILFKLPIKGWNISLRFYCLLHFRDSELLK